MHGLDLQVFEVEVDIALACGLLAESLRHKGVRHVVYDHGLAVRRQVVGSEEPFAEIRADLRYPLLDISGIRYFLDFVQHQAVTVSIESLALS